MAYTRVNWVNAPSTATPQSAANLNVMDAGIATLDTNKAELSGATFTGTVNVSSGSLQKAGKNVVFAQAGLTGKFSAQSTAPTSPADGDLWLDTSVVLG